MATREMIHLLKPVNVLDAAVYAATQTSTALDSQGFESVTYLILVGVWTAGSFTYKLQECDTIGGAYTDVVATDFQGNSVLVVNSAASDQNVLVLGYTGTKRFTKVVCTGASGSALFGVIGLLGHPRESLVLA